MYEQVRKAGVSYQQAPSTFAYQAMSDLDQVVAAAEYQPVSGFGRFGDLHLRLLLARLCVGGFPPFVANRLRSAALRLAGFDIGRGTIFWGLPTLIGTGDIYSRLEIGAECGFNIGSFFELEAPIRIGNHVRVGHDVMILTAGRANAANESRYAPVVIEDGTWIGARCTILPGVTIGAGAVIGATSVVSQDVPPSTLLLGTQKISLARWR